MIKTIGVIGAGQMGTGIAQVVAQAGFEVFLMDSSQEALKNAFEKIKESLKKLFEKKMLVKNPEKILRSIIFKNNLLDLKSSDLIIEAIIEDKHLKKRLFEDLDKIIKKEAIFASNTSSISITDLASATKRAPLFIGMHFMNPVPIMPLVEIINGHFTHEETVISIKEVALKMGKVITTSKDYPGFIANRILMPMINEAFYTLMQGIGTAKDIDETLKKGCNFPMGPLALADFIGLDVCLAILEVMHEGFGQDKYAPCPLLKNYVLAGNLGKKSKRGVFDYGI